MLDKQCTINWSRVSEMLREAMEEYQYSGEQPYTSLNNVIDELEEYIKSHKGGENKAISRKTIRRDIGNSPRDKKWHPIQPWRIKIYAKWLYEELHKNRAWIAKWLELTGYPKPGKLLIEMVRSPSFKAETNVPPLRMCLWKEFLGRHDEIRQLKRWADSRQTPVAILYGFGGNGKTTIQKKIGEDFIYGKDVLQWPYEAAVWVSAVDYSKDSSLTHSH